MVTAAPPRRLVHALVALALTGSAATLGLGATAAWADPTPAPGVVTTDPVAADPPAEQPATQPSIGSWIIGGTELESTGVPPVAKPAVKPAAKPAVKPVAAKPAAQPAAQPVAARPATVRTYSAPATVRTRATSTSTAPTAGIGSAVSVSAVAAPDGATVLPFTGGGHVGTALPTGAALVLLGIGLTFLSRPRRTATALA